MYSSTQIRIIDHVFMISNYLNSLEQVGNKGGRKMFRLVWLNCALQPGLAY